MGLSKETAGCLCVSTIISLALFFGLFFGLNYPEILRFEYIPTTCTTLCASLIPRYCCQTNCDGGCASVSLGALSCFTALQSYQNTDPITCASSNSCPVNGYPCDHGYHCCSTVCSTCRRCTTTDKKTTCSNYICNCVCVSSVSHRQCSVTCNQCYTSSLYLTYTINSGEVLTTTHSTDVMTNRQAAVDLIDKYGNGTVYPCYYHPTQTNQLILEAPAYASWKWAITSLFGIIPLVGVLICWCVYCNLGQIVSEWVRSYRTPAPFTSDPPPLEAIPIPVAREEIVLDVEKV